MNFTIRKIKLMIGSSVPMVRMELTFNL